MMGRGIRRSTPAERTAGGAAEPPATHALWASRRAHEPFPEANAEPEAVNAPLTIISGGQTGVDRAALDFALLRGAPHDGWCPRGRLAEDGPLAPRYQLRETETARYEERTRRNVEDSDATVVFSRAASVSGGTRLTLHHARRLGRPVLHLVEAADKPVAAHAAALRGLIATHGVARLNVAGPRASQAPGLHRFVQAVLAAAIGE